MHPVLMKQSSTPNKSSRMKVQRAVVSSGHAMSVNNYKIGSTRLGPIIEEGRGQGESFVEKADDTGGTGSMRSFHAEENKSVTSKKTKKSMAKFLLDSGITKSKFQPTAAQVKMGGTPAKSTKKTPAKKSAFNMSALSRGSALSAMSAGAFFMMVNKQKATQKDILIQSM